jgi:predicted N-formylglutamate amidohydrolase
MLESPARDLSSREKLVVMKPTLCPIVTCEHGGNLVPKAYSNSFRSAKRALLSHRGYDPGALELAKEIAEAIRSPCLYSKTTRLLVDLNRSVGHSALHSEFISHLSADQLNDIVEAHYVPYRQSVIDAVQSVIAGGQVACHLSIHTFTPKLAGVVRHADVAVLYDPRRPREKQLARDWLDAIDQEFPGLKRRRNYPYRGTADGFTTYLRRNHSPNDYVGLELEVNQRFPAAAGLTWSQLRRAITNAIGRLVRP